MIMAAQKVVQLGIVPLSILFKEAFPSVTYHVSNAKRHLLQMALITICIQEPSSGVA